MANSRQQSDDSQTNPEIHDKKTFFKHSQAAVQHLHMSEENQEMIQEMLRDLHIECLSDGIEAKNLQRDERYWGRIGDKRLQLKGITVNPEWESTEKFYEETNQYALRRLTQCGFEKGRCLAALSVCDDDVGAALEELVCSSCGIKTADNQATDDVIEAAKQQRDEECLALKSIYDDNFNESIPNKLWTINVSMGYLEEKFKALSKIPVRKDPKKAKKPNLKGKNVCRFFLMGKCKYGSRCKMSHVLEEEENKADDQHLKTQEKPVQYILEVRFPRGSCYPFEQPVLVFYTTSEVIPPFVSLNITKILNEEAKELSELDAPVVFSAISILEDMERILLCASMEPSEFSLPEQTKVQTTNSFSFRRNVRTFPSSANKDTLYGVKKVLNSLEKEALSKKLKKQFENQKTVKGYISMLENRINLPAWNSKDQIISSLKSHQILVISGMTGCGKTTQIPQFILDSYLEGEQGAECNIICTQPRRISAMSVAERVADERAEKLGDMIGYKIRLESKQSSSTRLLYCTTGILLRTLENDSSLTGVSHVIVDEIHERTEESDFLMMVLRDLIMERCDLRIILMSATLNAKLFSEYFCDAPVIHIPGRTFPVHEYYLEDAIEKTKFQMDPSSPYARPMKRSKSKQFDDGFKGAGNAQNLTKMAGEVMSSNKKPPANIKDEALSERQMEKRYEGFSASTISSLYTMDYNKTNFDLVVSVLEWIVTESEDANSGAVLVFLSGLAEIMSLLEQLSSHAIFKDSKRFLTLPLHSTLSSEEQALVFKRPKDGITKIILSTNIAETSVTIDDVVFVIDCGKMKETRYDSSKGMESLEETWVSRANARQRRGRAGRVKSGVCFHMFTSHRYNFVMQEHQVPEIKRVPLEKLCLRIKIMTLFHGCDVKTVLNKLLEPPTENAIRDSLTRLHSLGALDTMENLTSLGYHLAALPVDVRIGKLMLLGAIFRCLDPVLTIAAALSYKSPFNAPFEKRDEADKKRKQFGTGCSDHLTLLNAYQKWIEVMNKSTSVGYRYCYDNFLSVKTLQMIASLKCLFAELLSDIGFLETKMTSRQLERLSPHTGDGVLQGTGPAVNSNADNHKLLLGVLCGALYPNVVQVVRPATKYKVSSGGAIPLEPKAAELKFWTKTDGQVFIHPKSVNFDTFNFDSPYLIFHEKVKTSKVYVRDTSMVSVYSLLLFCGDSLNINLEKGALVISIDDGWVRFICSSHQVARLVRTLRVELDKLLSDKIESPSFDLTTCPRGSRIIDTIGHLISTQ